MEWIQKLAGAEGERFLPVLDMINREAADPEWENHVSVLGLTCGTGKSSAVSLKIAATLHAVRMEGSHEGILIVSDRKKSLKEYLEPDHMPGVKAYLDQCADMISRMDEDTYLEEKERFWRCPVLLMTYARYFSSDRSLIKNRYLKWGHGNPRTCIIMDEEPPILEYITIGNSEIAEVDAAIRNGLATNNAEERTWCLETWEKIRDRMHDILEGHGVNLFGDSGEELFLYKAEEEILPKQDLRRFLSDIGRSQETILEQNLDVPVLLDEMIRAVFRGAYGSGWRKQEGNLDIALYAVRNNGKLITNLGAKVIVLDGTADISTAYDHEYIHMVPCDDVNTRKFPELTIRLVNLNTSKAAFARRQDVILMEVREYLEAEGESLNSVMVITHKNRPERGFRRENRYRFVEHIGNTRGRNDLSESHKVAQVGLHRKPPIMYTLECFELIEEKAHGEENFSSVVWDYPAENINGFLHLMNTVAKEPDDLMIREAAADFEQNVFRTALRKPENTQPVTYYLFADTDIFSRLVWLISERFEGKYGSSVEQPVSVRTMVMKIRSRESAAHRLIDWLAMKEAGEIFEKQNMLTGSELTENQFASIKKDHAMIAAWFNQMYEALPPSGPRKGYYMMTAEILEYLK